MASDVRRLFTSIGAPGFPYQEVVARERAEAAVARWPALAATNRVLSSRLPPEPKPAARARKRGPFTVALASLCGGTGRTTLAANLAAALAAAGRKTVAVDLDPQNALGLHFGMDPAEKLGLSQKGVTAPLAQSYLGRSRAPVAHLPFGQCAGAELAALEWALTLEKDWLRSRLEEWLPADVELVVLDTPASRSAWAAAAFGIADAALVVLGPDAASYGTLPATEALLDEHLSAEARRRVSLVVNQFDARRQLDRDVLAALRGVYPEAAAPLVVQSDESVRLASARKRLLGQEAPDSQALADVSAIAEWVETGAAQSQAQAERRLQAAT